MANRMFRALTLALPALLLAACLDIDAKIDATGSGTMSVTLEALGGAKPVDQRKDFESAAVKVEKVEIGESKAVYELKFDDVTKLNTTKFFGKVSTTLTEENGKKSLVARVPLSKKEGNPDGGGKLEIVWRISLTVPGEIVESNADKTEGSTVKWEISPSELHKNKTPEVLLKVTFTVPTPSPAAS